MLLTFIFTIAYSIISWFISWFPLSSGFPSSVYTAVSSLGGYTGILQPLVPFSTLAQCVALIITVELLILSFKSLKWIISHIPFLGGRG